MNKTYKYVILVEKVVDKMVGRMWKRCGKIDENVEKFGGVLKMLVEKGRFAREFAYGIHFDFHVILGGFTDRNGRISTFST